VEILLGLGNPGPDFRATRHNLGFLVIEEIRRRHDGAPVERRGRSLLCRVQLGDHEILLARPQTYMNRSGEAAEALLKLARATPRELLVICDDLYLDLGTIRIRPRGSHGGHNGLRSIIERLGTNEFPRLRIGVGPPEPGTDRAAFVLEPFARGDRERLKEIVRQAADCAEAIAADGLLRAMNRFNRRPSMRGTG